jgi:hypothetical protein
MTVFLEVAKPELNHLWPDSLSPTPLAFHAIEKINLSFSRRE